MKPVYLEMFTCKKDIEKEFEVKLDKDDVILLAYYNHEDYGCDGEAFVLFERKGKFYEVHGGHCSCFGLEGQWEPEKTNITYLRKSAEDTLHWTSNYHEELKKVVGRITKRNKRNKQ